MSVYSWEYRQWPCRLEKDIECPGAIVKLSCELLLTASAKNLTQALWQRNIYFYLLIYLFSSKHYLKGSLMARIFSKIIIVVETQMYDVTINHIVSIIKIFKSINLQRKKKYVHMCVLCENVWICGSVWKYSYLLCLSGGQRSTSCIFLYCFLTLIFEQVFLTELRAHLLTADKPANQWALGIHLPIPVFQISVTCCSSFYVGARNLNSCYVCIVNISFMDHLSSPCWNFLFLSWNLREMIHTTLPIYILINISKIWKYTHIPQT